MYVRVYKTHPLECPSNDTISEEVPEKSHSVVCLSACGVCL